MPRALPLREEDACTAPGCKLTASAMRATPHDRAGSTNPRATALLIASLLPEYALGDVRAAHVQCAGTGGDRLAASDNGELR